MKAVIYILIYNCWTQSAHRHGWWSNQASPPSDTHLLTHNQASQTHIQTGKD